MRYATSHAAPAATTEHTLAASTSNGSYAQAYAVPYSKPCVAAVAGDATAHEVQRAPTVRFGYCVIRIVYFVGSV